MTDADADPRPARKPWRFGPAVGGLTAIVAGVVVAISLDDQPSPPKVPDPNGYDDLIRAGSGMKGDWPHRNLIRMDPAELRPWVEANREALDLARVGLGRECLVTIENNPQGLARPSGPLRSVSSLLQAEAIVFEADGRFLDASKSYLDKLALGQAVTQGGMGSDVQIGTVIQTQAIAGLRRLRDRLPRESIPPLLRELEAIDRRRVSLKEVEARWLAWYHGAHDPLSRAMLRWSGSEKSGRSGELTMARQGLERASRSLRFLLAEFAIHSYHEDKETWPRSLDALVPAYLASVPTDPVLGLPLDYPANASGELTDDLEGIARPDGEIAVRPASPPEGDPGGDRPD